MNNNQNFGSTTGPQASTATQPMGKSGAGALNPSGASQHAPTPQSHNAPAGDNTGLAAIGAQAKEAASELVGQTTALVKGQVAREGGRRLDDLSHVADALRKTGEGLEDNMAAPYIGMAADQIEKVSQYLRTAEPKQIVRSVESFARREPLLFLGGAFALGMLGARFIKSTREGVSTPRESAR